MRTQIFRQKNIRTYFLSHTESTKFTENKFAHGVRTQIFRQKNIRTYSLQTIFKHTIILWISWILCAIKICSYVLMSKIILRCPRAKIFDNSVNFVDSVCNKNYPCVPTSKFCVQQKICSYALMSKIILRCLRAKFVFLLKTGVPTYYCNLYPTNAVIKFCPSPIVSTNTAQCFSVFLKTK